MSQRYHQHIFLPFIPNPFCFIEVTEDYVRWQQGFNQRFKLPIESVRARLDPKGWFWGQVLGTGDVVIIEATEHRVANVLRGRALREQIARKRSLKEELRRAAPGNEAETTRPPLDPSLPLEPFIICIPCVDEVIDSLLYRLSRGSSELNYALDGQLVRAGDRIATVSGYDVVAPVDGKFRAVSSRTYRDINWSEYESISVDDPKNPTADYDPNTVLATIQPVQGADISGYIQHAYREVIERLDRYGWSDRRTLSWYIEGKTERERIEALCMQHLSSLKSAKGRFSKNLTRERARDEQRERARDEWNQKQKAYPTEWQDIMMPGEILRAYGNDWPIYIFTGKLVRQRGEVGHFVDSKGREKPIDLSHETIPNDELYSQMNIGDILTMAYFSDSAGHSGTYFLLYDHKRQREYPLPRSAGYDLQSPQYERIRNLVLQKGRDQVEKTQEVSESSERNTA